MPQLVYMHFDLNPDTQTMPCYHLRYVFPDKIECLNDKFLYRILLPVTLRRKFENTFGFDMNSSLSICFQCLLSLGPPSCS